MVASGLENRGVLKPTKFDSLVFRQTKQGVGQSGQPTRFGTEMSQVRILPP